MAKFKRKGCGPRGLGSALKMVEQGRIYREDNNAQGSINNHEFEDKNAYHRFNTFDKVKLAKGKKFGDFTTEELRNLPVTVKGPGSFAVPTAKEQKINENINAQFTNETKIPYQRGDATYTNKTNQKPKQETKPKQSTKTTTEKTKPKGKVAYGGTKTWAEGSKAAKASTGKSLNQLVAARKGLKKGSAEYNTIQNQINTALGSKKRHGTPAKKKGYGKKRR